MRDLSVVILSKTPSNLGPCVDAIARHESSARIVVIWDGNPFHVFKDGQAPWKPNPRVRQFTLEDGVRDEEGDLAPFIFARNANQGMQVHPEADVVLLNDDAILQTPGGLSLMQIEAEYHQDFGLIGSTCNVVGNTNQYPQAIGLREDERMVCFVCVLIPRRTIDAVGWLDERFTGYGMEDDDYCKRVRMAGLKIGIHDGCYVEHGKLVSTFRGPGGVGGDFKPNLRRYIEKWGVDNRGLGFSDSPWRDLFRKEPNGQIPDRSEQDRP